MKRKPNARPAVAFAVVAAFGVIAAGLVLAHNVRNRPDSEGRTIARATPGTVYADQNNDGVVTRREAKVSPPLARSFDRYDLNDDGALDRAEFARLEASSIERRDDARAATEGDAPGGMRPRQEYEPD